MKHCCSEVERASALRARSRSNTTETTENLPNPPSTPILPKTELEEAAIELGAILSGGEQALLLASIHLVLVSPTKYEPYDENPRAQCSNYIEVREKLRGAKRRDELIMHCFAVIDHLRM